ncbi:hypothetical protein [uncultured Slackia sp.]|uniref:hypothetical protein n=1 Tax=uncultured Slackia sp. TaxID=665903 RepID=UPI0025853E70|nr:hypothetical protein [uncultured Slackia sp.]
MANRRMFALSVVESDAFLDLSIEARAAYFHLGMHTDDDGFVGNPRTVCRVAGVPLEAVDELAAVGFITVFDSGVIHVSHFSTNNSIRKDRYTPTEYQNEKIALDQGADMRQPSDNQAATNGQPNISKEREAEANSGEGSLSQTNLSQANPIQESAGALGAPYPAHAREEPTFEEVKAYAETLPQPVPKLHCFMNWMQINGWPGDWREALERWKG